MISLAVVAVASIPAIGVVRILAHWSNKEQASPPEFDELIGESFGVRLPPGAVVKSARLPAGMDSAGLYELRLSEGADLVEGLIEAAKARGWTIESGRPAEVDIATRYAGVPVPSWWNPGPDLGWVALTHPQGACTYHIAWSAAEDRVLVYWMTT